MGLNLPFAARRVSYTATAGQTVFAFAFPVLAAADLKVSRTRNGQIAVLTRDVDYGLAGIGAQGGVTVTLAAGATAGDQITIEGDRHPERASQLAVGPLTPDMLNADLNAIVVATQELYARVGRAMLLAPGDGGALGALPTLAARAGKVLGFDGQGLVTPLALEGVDYKGGWLSGEDYARTDVVLWDGGLYYCISDHTAEASTKPASGGDWVDVWQVFIPRMFQPSGSWTDETVYPASAIVEASGTSYICTVAHTASTDTQPGQGADWETVWQLLVGSVTAIPDNTVTLAKIADIATARLIGRASAGTGDPESLTGTQATALLDVMTGDDGTNPGKKGLVGAPAAGDVADKKLWTAAGWLARVASNILNDSIAAGETLKDALDDLGGRLDAIQAGQNAAVDTFAEAKSYVDAQTARIDAILASANAAMDSFAEVYAAITAIQADNWVTSARIAANAVTSTKIADGAVTTSKIPDGQVTGAKLTANAVANDKMAAMAAFAFKMRNADTSGNVQDVNPTDLTALAEPGSTRLVMSFHPTTGEPAVSPLSAISAGGGGGGSFILPSLVLNGDFQINQRAFAGGALTAGAYGFDMWKASSGGANLSISGTRVTLASGEIEQVIDPTDWGHETFASKTVTVSIDGVTDQMTVTLGSASGTVPGGATVGARGSVDLSLGAGDTGPLTLKLKRTAAGSVTFGKVRVTLGGDDLWVPRPFGDELSLCQRYYWKTYDLAVAPGTVITDGSLFAIAAATSVNGVTFALTLPVTMKTAPTCTLYSPATGATGKMTRSGTTDISAAATIGQSTARIYNSVTTTIAAHFVHAVLDASP